MVVCPRCELLCYIMNVMVDGVASIAYSGIVATRHDGNSGREKLVVRIMTRALI